MSRFLGPIHYVVFNRIKTFEDLEKNIIDKIIESCDADISTLVNQVYEEYGKPLGDEPLEELIDTDNIHGWLQNRIDVAESRHAALISNILSVYGDKAFHVMKSCYERQGAEAGLKAKEAQDMTTAPALYQGVYNYILDGMPCDQVNEVIINEENHVKWQVRNCLHRKYWKDEDENLNLFYQLREAWMTQFVSNANPQFIHHFEQKDVEEAPTLIHEIIKEN